jgi:outer membrane protein OmpA-like peptidoglycan-associated protein
MNKPPAALAALSFLPGRTSNPYTGEQRISITLAGAGIGASAATLSGGGVGLYMNQRETRLRQRPAATGPSVTRPGPDIILNMPDNSTLDFGRADIKPQSYGMLNAAAIVLNALSQTIVDVG